MSANPKSAIKFAKTYRGKNPQPPDFGFLGRLHPPYPRPPMPPPVPPDQLLEHLASFWMALSPARREYIVAKAAATASGAG